jgi:adenosylcobinamide-GDP ribazoletransferase
MNMPAQLRRTWLDFLSSVQFLTRIPVPSQTYEADTLTRAVKFFPVVGALIGGSAALVHQLFAPHLPRVVTALLVVVWLVFLTGCLHEDGLADVADGFGGGWNREQVLLILRDSRIGSYGAAALMLSLLARILLISSLPLAHVAQYLITAHVLSRWTTLPLSCFLPPAREPVLDRADGQGARIARLTTRGTLIAGTAFSFGVAAAVLRFRSVIPVLISVAVTFCSALYYRRRIGGVTGDCFGATNQLAEVAVYLCGAWTA